MSKTVSTGWRSITPGQCLSCGFDDDWQCDGRGNVLCGCQSCPECGIVDAYGFHNPGCPTLDDDELDDRHCPECEGDMDIDCFGGLRCPECDDPCPGCYDGGCDA